MKKQQTNFMQQNQTEKENAIKSILKDYLSDSNTDYAIMISGKWGCGKTHFAKEKLNEYISKESVPESQKKKEENCKNYEFVYVSLYGISSVEDIQDAMFFETNPKYKWAKILAGKALPMILDSVPYVNKLNLPSLFKKQDIQEKICSNYNNKVFVFDDLERINDDKINIKTALGYLNNLSEHNHYKVIIIANDEKLDANYLEFKEKTVRFSYNFAPNLSEIIDTILEKYKDKNDYYHFLKKQKDLIITIFNASSCSNIRTLIFITDVYLKIFQGISGEYKDDINRDFLTILTVLSIEAKEGIDKDKLSNCIRSLSNRISALDIVLNENQESSEDNEDSFNNGNEVENERYEKAFKKRYSILNINRLTFYPELLDLVFYGYISPDSIKSIVEGFRTQYIQKESSKSQTLVSQISDWTSIDDKELRSIINDIKTAVSNGDYGVYDILKTYAYLCQIEGNGIIELKNEDTENFEKAIKNTMDKTEYSPLFDLQALRWDESEKSTAKEKYEKLRLYAVGINDDNKHKDMQSKQEDILCMIKENEKEKFSEFVSKPDNWGTFIGMDPKEIAIAITSASNEIKTHFYNGLCLFFPVHIQSSPEMLRKDVDFLENIKKHINEHIQEQKGNTISEFNIKRICTYIDKVLESYNYILQHRK